MGTEIFAFAPKTIPMKFYTKPIIMDVSAALVGVNREFHRITFHSIEEEEMRPAYLHASRQTVVSCFITTTQMKSRRWHFRAVGIPPMVHCDSIDVAMIGCYHRTQAISSSLRPHLASPVERILNNICYWGTRVHHD
jgi:hypothetical protein